MWKLLRILPIFLLASFGLFGQVGEVDHWEAIFNSNAIFKYWSSNKGIPDINWRANDFNADSWDEGRGGIGYGDDDDSTIIDICNSVFLRTSFNIINTSDIAEAVLYIDFDDAFVAYLNGVEIARSDGLDDAYPDIFQLSTVDHEAGSIEKFKIDSQ